MNLEEFYKRNYRSSIKKVMPYVSDYAVAEDLVQEAFTKALGCIDQYDEKKGEFKGWFTKVLFSVLWNYKRANKRIPNTIDISEVLDSEELSYCDEIDLIPYLKKRTNKHHRKVLIARFLLGYSDTETAEVCKTSPENVRKVVQRFRETVRCLSHNTT